MFIETTTTIIPWPQRGQMYISNKIIYRFNLIELDKLKIQKTYDPPGTKIQRQIHFSINMWILRIQGKIKKSRACLQDLGEFLFLIKILSIKKILCLLKCTTKLKIFPARVYFQNNRMLPTPEGLYVYRNNSYTI